MRRETCEHNEQNHQESTEENRRGQIACAEHRDGSRNFDGELNCKTAELKTFRFGVASRLANLLV